MAQLIDRLGDRRSAGEITRENFHLTAGGGSHLGGSDFHQIAAVDDHKVRSSGGQATRDSVPHWVTGPRHQCGPAIQAEHAVNIRFGAHVLKTTGSVVLILSNEQGIRVPSPVVRSPGNREKSCPRAERISARASAAPMQ